MATLSDLGKKVRNTRNRLSSLFITVVKGSINYYFAYSLGRIMNASFSGEPVASSPDQDGRESAQLFDITVSFALMQTSSEELSLLEDLAMHPDPKMSNGHFVYASGSKMSADDYDSVISKQDGLPDYTLLADKDSPGPYDPDGIFFKNALLKPSPEINLSGDESSIGIEIVGRIRLDTLRGFGDEDDPEGNYVVFSEQ